MKQSKAYLFGVVLAAVLCSAPLQAQRTQQAEQKQLDVPYVPTPPEVVETMLSLAAVRESDVLYDLGCGDGRIAITAARRGAQCVGVDLDPERISECSRNAREARVADRVQFVKQDLFKTDFSRASVLALYLLPAVNVKLRPRILRELQPGTRVVSHDFDMGDWEPDKTAQLNGHVVYYWVVPANVSGAWSWGVPGDDGIERHVLQLDQRYQQVRGTLSSGKRALPVRDARISGGTLAFSMEQEVDGKRLPVRFEGTVRGNVIEGVMKTANGSYRWSARRDPATAAAIDRPAGKLMRR